MRRYIFLLFLLLLLFGATYIFRWNLYYLFLNPYFPLSLFLLLLLLFLIFKIRFKGALIFSLITLSLLFIFNQYLLKLDIQRGIPVSETVVEKMGGEEEFFGKLFLTKGDLAIKGVNGENLFIFDYYSPIKVMKKTLERNGIKEFVVKDAGSIFLEGEKRDWEFFVNKEAKTKICVKGNSLNLNGDLREIKINKLNVNSKVLYFNLKVGEKERVVNLNLKGVSLIGEIEIPQGFYVEIRLKGNYIFLNNEEFKNIGKGVYVREGDNGRIYIKIEGKGVILTIKEESND